MLFVACLPLLFVTLSLRWAINDPRLYSYGFSKYSVSTATGLSQAQLTNVARQLMDYFNSPRESLSITVVLQGRERPLFNARELSHLADIKGLIQGVYTVQWISLGWAITLSGFSLLAGRAPRRRWARQMLWGSGLTLAIFAALGIASLISFDRLFLQFHLISFANDLWMLDPSRDYLIRMFPEGFFFDATIIVAVGTIILAAASGVMAAVYLRRTVKIRRRTRRQAT